MDKLAEIERVYTGVPTNNATATLVVQDIRWLIAEIKRLREQQAELIDEIDGCIATRHAATRLWIANQAAYAIEQELSTRVV